MERDEIIAANPVAEECERRGMEFRKRQGKELLTLCPFHEDRSPSFRVNIEKQVWRCDPCDMGGSVIDLVMKLDGITAGEAMKKLGGDNSLPPSGALPSRKPSDYKNGSSQPNGSTPGKIVKTYDYFDDSGEMAYQVCRLEPKSFRQRHMVDGEWTWSMEGVRRVLYNLPAVIKADFVFVVEGEKDADLLNSWSVCATCNVGGAGKWMDSYTETLRGKEIILCGDNDEPGQKHVAKVMEAIAGAVRTTRVIKLPSEFKDVSDFAASFATQGEAARAFQALAEQAEVLIRGVSVPIRSMSEMEREYRTFAQASHTVSLDLCAWIPKFREYRVRPIVPGEVLTIVADTGVGKTMLLQNIAINTRLPTLLFELELPTTLTFERFVGMATRRGGANIHDTYRMNGEVEWRQTGKLDHVFVCPLSKLTPAAIEKIISQAGLKMGVRPAIVMLDYVQLVKGEGSSRYDKASSVAEELKVIAKDTGTIFIVTSQVSRKGSDYSDEIGVHDAKDSGSIENSSGFVLGAWRDSEDSDRLWLKILKNTKGTAGNSAKVACRITEGLIIGQELEDSEPRTTIGDSARIDKKRRKY